eukprot:scpid21378/ scgid24261/ 
MITTSRLRTTDDQPSRFSRDKLWNPILDDPGSTRIMDSRPSMMSLCAAISIHAAPSLLATSGGETPTSREETYVLHFSNTSSCSSATSIEPKLSMELRWLPRSSAPGPLLPTAGAAMVRSASLSHKSTWMTNMHHSKRKPKATTMYDYTSGGSASAEHVSVPPVDQRSVYEGATPQHLLNFKATLLCTCRT